MKLTKRQKAFVELASQSEGVDPYDLEWPVLRNEEIMPLVENELVRFDEGAEVWRAVEK